MSLSLRIVFGASVIAMALTGCVSSDPQTAFDDLGRQVSARSGYDLRWMRDEPQRREIEQMIGRSLETNLTVQTAVAIALINNRSLQASFEELGISQAELAGASRLSNPEVAGSWRLPDHGPKVVNAEYSIAQSLLDLLALPIRKKMAARQLEGVKQRIAHEVLGLAADVQSAYYTVQAGEALTNRFSVLAEVSEAAADLARRQREAGNISDLELQNQDASFAQTRLEMVRAQVQLHADREQLNRLLGLWGPQTAWLTAGALPPLPEKELSTDNVESLAVSQRLDLAAARSEALNLRHSLKLQRNIRWIPGAQVGFDAERELDRSWVLGPTISFELPIFDQGQGEIARSTAMYRAALRKLEALAVQIRSEVRVARDALIAARDVAEYHQKILLPQRQQILRSTLLHYNAMQKSNYELLLAKEYEQQEEQAAIEALRDYWIARAELVQAVGGGLAK